MRNRKGQLPLLSASRDTRHDDLGKIERVCDEGEIHRLRARRQRYSTLALLETDEPTNDSDRLAGSSRVGNAKPVVPARVSLSAKAEGGDCYVCARDGSALLVGYPTRDDRLSVG